MALVATPKLLQGRSEFYHQFGVLLQAGIPLIQALETLRRSLPAGEMTRRIPHLLHGVKQGLNLTESFLGTGAIVPSFDIALLAAGERSGRLDQCLKLLGEFYRSSADWTRKVWGQCVYPFVIVHVGIFLGPITTLIIKGDVAGYLTSVLTLLVPCYAVVLLIAWALQGDHRGAVRRNLERVFDRVPLFGAARRNLALSRLSLSLEALISAGVTILDAWPVAARASGATRLVESTAAWIPEATTSGLSPGELLPRQSDFPEMFTSLYRTGETTGSLDETLRRLHAYYLEEGLRQMKLVAEWMPRLVYFGIAIWVAFRVVSFYSSYFEQIGKVLEP